MPIKGDFISFSYNSVHSTELGVVHVSTSDRYTDSLLPTIQDKTVQVPGSDGTYFFGSYYTQRPITLSLAFDNVDEGQIRRARNLFGDRKSHPLIFDEEPYKVYYAKITGTPQLQYIPFNNYDDDAATRPRIYKGEGTITFTCFEPFAHCPSDYKYLDIWNVPGDYIETDVTAAQYTGHESDYYKLVNGKYVQCTDEDAYDSSATYYTIYSGDATPNWYKYNNKNEWNYSAGLLATQGTYDRYTNGGFKLYNPGDLETDFKFVIPISADCRGIKVTHQGDLDSYTLNINQVMAKGSDTHLLFNSKTNLIEGLVITEPQQEGDETIITRSMNLYNEYIQSGHWFKIPVINDQNEVWQFVPIFNGQSSYSGTGSSLEYDYLYF